MKLTPWIHSKYVFIFFVFCLISQPCFAQPANNTCANATLLNVGASCGTPTIGTNVGATSSGINPGCNSYAGGDVWFKFVAPANGQVIIETSDDNFSFVDTGVAVYSSCGGMLLGCDADSGIGSFSVLSVNGLTPGNTYYIAVWEWNNDNMGTFGICVWNTPNTPSNDECMNATPLTVNPDLSCGIFSSGSVVSSTQSTDPESCPATFDDDVWYSFVATSTEHLVTINNISGSVIDLIYQLSTGTCGGGLTEISCHDAPDVGFIADMLVVGTTYYVRVATFVSTPGQTTSFDICIGTEPSIPPTNDNCATATPLTVSGPTCTNPYTANNGGATTSQVVHTCANYLGGDQWFSFVAPPSGQATVETYDEGNNIFGDTGIAIYDGCGGNLLDCDDDDGFGFYSQSVLTGLTPGATYYIAVWDGFNDFLFWFDICVYDPTGTPPVCPSDFQFGANGGLTSTETGVNDYETDGPIESVQLLTGAARVDYDSRHSVTLMNGFEASASVLFNAFIDGCNGGLGGVNLQNSSEEH